MGELLDAAGAFFRHHLKALVQLFSAFAVVEFAAAQFLEKRFASVGPVLQALQNKKGVPPQEVLAAAGGLAMAYLFTLSVLGLTTLFASVAVSRYVGRAQLGEPESVGEALQASLRSAPRMLAAMVTFGFFGALLTFRGMLPGGALGIAGGTLLPVSPLRTAALVIGALLMVLGVTVALLSWFLRSLMLGPLLALETGSGFWAYRRAGQLLSGKAGPAWTDRIWVRASITVTVVTLFALVMALVSQLPLDILRYAYGHSAWSLEATDSVPAYLSVPAKLFGLFIQCFFGSFSLTFMTFFYLDCRARKEGLDLASKLDALGPGTA